MRYYYSIAPVVTAAAGRPPHRLNINCSWLAGRLLSERDRNRVAVELIRVVDRSFSYGK